MTAALPNQAAGLRQTVQVLSTPHPEPGSEVSGNPHPVWALIPCFNRPADLRNLLSDLANLRRPAGIRLTVLVIDNASTPPLVLPPLPLDVELLRLPRNTGGSGGFNAGLSDILSRGRAGNPDELLWLLDSDARVEPDALIALVRALDSRPDAVAAGSALATPGAGHVFEVGGHVDPRTGEYRQFPLVASASPIEVQYVAACSMMVRRTAVERAGLMPDVFINGDDVEWCLRLAARTGGRILAVPSSIARHPNPDKMRTWDRYYAARNAFAPIERLGLGGLTRFRRALRETGRAAAQALVGRDDLADLHLRGLQDALSGRTTGAPEPPPEFRPFQPIDHLADALRALPRTTPTVATIGASLVDDDALAARIAGSGLRVAHRAPPRTLLGVLTALLFGEGGIAIVSARARPADWSGAPTVITVAPQGFSIASAGRWRRLLNALAVATRGGVLALGLGLRGPGAPPRIPAAPRPEWTRLGAGPRQAPAADLSIVVLSHNRWPALDRTLSTLRDDPSLRGARVIVVDNASTDSSADLVRQHHPGATVIQLQTNAGVAGFNRGVEAAGSEFILILDDDAAPAPGAIASALELLRSRPDLGAVALHPRHPATGRSEWPFAGETSDAWPVMGCANLVRTEAWRRVGGYEEGFFLYRNDTDLALELAEAGWGVRFDPEWVALHDSPAAAAKSLRWLELATRNWIWLCRRHGRGLSKTAAILAGWAWAHGQARWSARGHVRVAKGAMAGLLHPAPALPEGLHSDGEGLRRLLSLRFGRRQATNRASIDRHSP